VNESTHAVLVFHIREALTDQGLSQAEFARRVGVSQKHLCKVLGGSSNAQLATLDYWAFVLGFRFMVGRAPLQGMTVTPHG
jgi:transcriptional regulator with XRE-family HTH domain